MDATGIRHREPSRPRPTGLQRLPAGRHTGLDPGNRWYVPAALREENATSARRSRLPTARAGAALAALALAGAAFTACGEDEQRQDAGGPAGDFPVKVVTAKFPTEQRLAQASELRLEVENIGDEALPDLAVTINTGDDPVGGAFDVRSDQPGLADPSRPVWILENDFPKLAENGATGKDLDKAATAGAAAAQTNTFSFGQIEPGESKEMVWRVTPIQGGTFTVRYELAAGLNGKANAVTADGSPVEGEFVVTIEDKPARSRVNDAGAVVTEGG